MAAMIRRSPRGAALPANAQIIGTLRLVGARDVFIARAFCVRRPSRLRAALRRGGGHRPLAMLAIVSLAACGRGDKLSHRPSAYERAEWLWRFSCGFARGRGHSGDGGSSPFAPRQADVRVGLLQWLRSLAFVVTIYCRDGCAGLAFFLPPRSCPATGPSAIATPYCRFVRWAAAWMVGLRTEVRGTPPKTR